MKQSARTLALSCGLALVLATANAHAQVTELPQIVITAPAPIPTRAEVQPGDTVIVGDAFVPVTVVPAGAIVRSPANTLSDVMFTLPGVTSSTYGPLASRPIIRGLDNYRVRVQDSGIGVHDVSALGEDHAVPIDPLIVEQIEVVRGPATLRWGSQAIGGVVNAVTGRIPEMLRQPGMNAIFKGALSSVDRGIDGAIILEGAVDRFAFHADYYRRQADDYMTPHGIQANTSFRAEGAAIGGSWFFDQGWLGFSISRHTSLYHVPGIEAAATNTRIDQEQTKFASKGEWRPEIAWIDSVRFSLGISDYKHDEIGIDTGTGLDGIRATFKNREQEARVEIQHVPLMTMLGALKGVVGAQAGRQQLSTEGEAGSLLAPAQTLRLAGFVFEELKLSDTLRAHAAGRIESVRVRGTGAEFPATFMPPPPDPTLFPAGRTLVPMSVSFGLLKDLPWGLIATATAQYVERAPEAPELFSKGPHDATKTFEIGDPTLQKEAARTIEIGLKRPKGDFRFEASAYYTKYAGFIFKRLTGIMCGDDFASCGVGTELTQIVYSQHDATFYGAEMMAQLDLMPLGGGIFGVDGRYDFVRARFEDGSAVPRIPPQRIGGGIYWRDERWLARVSLLHAFDQNEIAANETPTAGYNLLRAELNYRHKFVEPGLGPREIVLGIVGDNLLDEDIRNHVSFNKNEVLLPGRNFRGFFRTTF